MTDWHPRNHMGLSSYIWFKMGQWAEVETVPKWVQQASNTPAKTEIPANGSVEAVFSGDSLEYLVRTKRLPRGAGTRLEQEYAARIKDHFLGP